MKPQSILRMDRILGTPGCYFLSLIEAVIRPFRKKEHALPRKIVFIKLIEMGSTVLACPAFEEAIKMVGRENIYFLAFKANRSIVDLLGYFPEENIITINDGNLPVFIMDLWRAMRMIRKEKIDTAIDMEGLTRSSAIITWLTGTKTRVGYHNFTSEGPYRGRLFTTELNYNFQHHTSRMFLALVRAVLVPEQQIPLLKEDILSRELTLPSFMPTNDEKAKVRSMLTDKTGVNQGKIILLNANCSDLLPLRRWPTENFIELGKKILNDIPGSTVIITGAPDEKEAAEKIAYAIGEKDRAFSLAGHTTLRQLLTLYGMSDLLISNDSGPCHFAALTKISIIALFGPETPLLYSPLSPNAECISAGFACSPCVNMLNHRFSPCNDNKCMQAIPIDRVYESVRKALDSK